MKQIERIKAALASHRARIIEPGNRTRAAVAIALVEEPEGLAVLFIERARRENDYWSGQIGFPGGRAEPGDAGPRETAERETREEIGLDLRGARYLGRLSDLAPGGLPIVISSFVYALPHRPELHPDPVEVAAAFWFPVQEFGNPERLARVEFRLRNRVRSFPALKLGEERGAPLWGITLRLLRNLEKTVTRAA